jgi:signal peptidase
MAGIGKAMKFLKTKTGFLVCILIPMALFFLFELFKLVMVIVQMRQQPAAITETDEEEIKKRAIEEYLAEQNKLKAQQESGEDKQPAEQKEQVPDKEASEEGAESTETSEASEQ